MSTPRTVWTPDMDAALVACRERGLCYLECAEKVGVSRHLIERRVTELGLPKFRGRGNVSIRKQIERGTFKPGSAA